MNTTDLQTLLDSQGANSSLTNPFGPLMETLAPLIGTIVVASIAITILFVIILAIGMIQKHRTHKAILRIDANLQKLVDAQKGSGSMQTTASERSSKEL